MNLVDTSVAIDHLRGRPEARNLLERIVLDGGSLAASELVRFELLAGVRPHEISALENFFSALTWLPVSEPVSRLAGELARQYRASFSGIDTADYLIAATSILHDAPLLTTNVKHFPLLSGLRQAYPD
ncbi:MAG: type II toxin-antitoxin system VapC family toxin [Trueperaceae bacterium]